MPTSRCQCDKGDEIMDLRIGMCYYNLKEKRNYLCVGIDKHPQWCEPEKHAVDEVLYSFMRCIKDSIAVKNDEIRSWISDKQWLNQLRRVK